MPLALKSSLPRGAGRSGGIRRCQKHPFFFHKPVAAPGVPTSLPTGPRPRPLMAATSPRQALRGDDSAESSSEKLNLRPLRNSEAVADSTDLDDGGPGIDEQGSAARGAQWPNGHAPVELQDATRGPAASQRRCKAKGAGGGTCSEKRGQSRGGAKADLADKNAGRKKPSSGFKGVTRHRRSGRWEAHIWIKALGRQVYLGGFENEELAAEAYDVAVLHSKGWCADTNFDKARYRDLFPVVEDMDFQEVVHLIRKSGDTKNKTLTSEVRGACQRSTTDGGYGWEWGPRGPGAANTALPNAYAPSYEVAKVQGYGMPALGPGPASAPIAGAPMLDGRQAAHVDADAYQWSRNADAMSLPPDRMPGQAMWAAAPSEPPLARRAPRHMSFDSVATNAQDSPVSYQKMQDWAGGGLRPVWPVRRHSGPVRDASAYATLGGAGQDAWRMADGVAARETRHPMAYTVDCAAIEADGAANADGPVAASFGRRGLWCQGRPGSEYCPLPEGRPFASGCWDARMDGCRARAPDHRGWKSDGATAGVGSMDGASTCVLTPPATSRPCPTLSVSITPETLLSPILDAPSLWSPHGAHPGCELLQDARVYGTEGMDPFAAATCSPLTKDAGMPHAPSWSTLDAARAPGSGGDASAAPGGDDVSLMVDAAMEGGRQGL